MFSVPARLGKGQGAKEIGHNLVRERPKFGHNLVRKRHKIGHSLDQVVNLWAILWAIDEKVANLQAQLFLHWLSENTTAITFCK